MLKEGFEIFLDFLLVNYLGLATLIEADLTLIVDLTLVALILLELAIALALIHVGGIFFVFNKYKGIDRIILCMH